MRRNKKVRKFIPYYWLYWFDGISITPCSHKRFKCDDMQPYRMIWFSIRKCGTRYGCIGWDIDRHRFFAGTSKNRYPNRKQKSRFLRENWERNHGYGSRSINKLHISFIREEGSDDRI